MKYSYLGNIKYLKNKRRKQIRLMMRGYRKLRKTRQLDKLATVKQELNDTKIDCRGLGEGIMFGAGLGNYEKILRQYLMLRVGNMKLNKAILVSIARNNSGVVYALPKEWRDTLEDQDISVAKIRSAVLWQIYIAAMLIYGILVGLKSIGKGLREILNPSSKNYGKYVYFESLGVNNIPTSDRNSSNENIITWYLRWSGRDNDFENIFHNVQETKKAKIDGVSIRPIESAFLPLNTIGMIYRYATWSILATVLASIDYLRGSWVNAFLLNQLMLATHIRKLPKSAIAEEYLFHNSGWIYRPLWTYEAAKRGAKISLYFYSTNIEPFREGNENIVYHNSWDITSWPRYIVWDKYQKAYIKSRVGGKTNTIIAGPIWFQNGSQNVEALPTRSILIFDVQPVRTSFYQALGLEIEYYTPNTSELFLSDILRVISNRQFPGILKRKRSIGNLVSSRYMKYIDSIHSDYEFVEVDPNLSAITLIKRCSAVISMPFTSTAILAREMGVPSIYYDPTKKLEPSSRQSHGIEVIGGVDKLRKWVESIDAECQ